MTGVSLAEVVRNGFVESHHRGSVVVLGPDGERRLALGDVDAPVFPRSSLKPVQAVAMLRSGLDVDGELLALAASSHSGEPRHVERVLALLAGAGLAPEALGNTPDLPLDAAVQQDYLRAGGTADRLHHNCSGKHAAMLATCVAAGWPLAGYLTPGHPLQQAVRDAVGALCAGVDDAVAVDGCGAPLFAVSLTGLATAFRALVRAAPGTPEHRVAAAMRAHPGLVGGAGRDVTLLMESLPGLLAKDGAEGVYAVALPDGSAVALKVDDGSVRARVPVLLAALRGLGVVPADPGAFVVPVLGGGRPVGEVRASF